MTSPIRNALTYLGLGRPCQGPCRPTPPIARVWRMHPDEVNQPAPIVLTPGVQDQIAREIGDRPAESGGMLGGRLGSGVVEAFHFDGAAETSGVTYSPNVEVVNRVLRESWNPGGIRLLGFVHSHPGHHPHPSAPDLEYGRRIMAGIPEMDRVILPIVRSRHDTGWFDIRGFAVDRLAGDQRLPISVRSPRVPGDSGHAFDRVAEAYDLAAMSAARIVAVGIGGSAGFLEDMARAGIGEFVLIDPDIVEEPNLATQQAYADQLGWSKVDAVAERIVRASPSARVWVVPARVEAIRDAGMRRLCMGTLPGSGALRPEATLLCAFTDSFPAQARLNRVALNLGVPFLAAAVYARGRAVELAFSMPGRTRACVRCILGGRYRAVLADPDAADSVTSHGCPIWATTRLNAAKQPIALALLHAATGGDPAHPARAYYARLMDAIAERNLVQIGLDLDIAETLGLSVFGRAITPEGPGLLMDTVAWLPQAPEDGTTYPACPDCGGTGDLTDSIGRFADTLGMPQEFGQFRVSRSRGLANV